MTQPLSLSVEVFTHTGSNNDSLVMKSVIFRVATKGPLSHLLFLKPTQHTHRAPGSLRERNEQMCFIVNRSISDTNSLKKKKICTAKSQLRAIPISNHNTHTHTHTHTLTLSLSLSHTLSLTLSLSFSHSVSLSLAPPPPLLHPLSPAPPSSQPPPQDSSLCLSR